MCQGCVNTGYLSQETYARIERFCDDWPRAAFGPAHIVLSDANVLDENIRFCLAEMDKPEWTEPHGEFEHSRDELAATRQFLESLLAIPEENR